MNNKNTNKDKIDEEFEEELLNFVIKVVATFMQGGNIPDIVKGKQNKFLSFIHSKIEEAYKKGLKQGDWNAETLKSSYETGKKTGIEEAKRVENKRVAEIVEKWAKDNGETYNPVLQDILQDILKAITNK